MKPLKFNSINELYNRLNPAFNIKKEEFNKSGLCLNEIDLWNYFKKEVWVGNKELNLYDMVNDILNLSEDDIKKYIDEVGNNDEL